nr:hypothetical protein [Lysinibacillus timonensis]
MKKWSIFASLLLAIALLFIWSKTASTNPLEVINSYNKEWGINLPQPNEGKEIWSSENNFHGDGEWVNVFRYSEEITLSESGLESLTANNLNEARKSVEEFIHATLSVYYDDDKEEVQKVFEQFTIIPEIGDYYFYSEKNEGFDYFIALFKRDESTLYTFEWHQ